MGEGDKQYAKMKGFKWTVGNEDVPALALVVDQTGRQLHITEPSDLQTDWAVAAQTNPTVYIHSASTPATNYISMSHDGTTGNIVPGGAAGKLAISATWTTAGTYGRPFQVTLTTDAAMGSYANAIKGYVDLSDTGSSSGLFSVINAEMTMAAGAGLPGHYVLYEAHFDCPTSWAGTNHAAYFWLESSGNTKANFDTYGDLWTLRGLTANSGKMLYNQTIRFSIEDVNYYLPYSTAEGTYTTAYPVVLTHASTPLAITSTMAATTGQDLATFTVTDSSVLASDYNRAIYINWTSTGTKTGGYINPISVDFNAITDVCGSEVALECFYITQTGNKLDSNVFGWQIYCEDLGTAVGNVEMLDMGRVMTNSATTGRDGFIRAKGHGGTCASILYCEGTSDALATQFAIFSGCSGATQLFVDGVNVGSGYTCAAVLRATYEGTPGTTTTQYYIPLYTLD